RGARPSGQGERRRPRARHHGRRDAEGGPRGRRDRDRRLDDRGRMTAYAPEKQLPTKDVRVYCAECERLHDGPVPKCDCGGYTETSYDMEDGSWTPRQRSFYEQYWPILPISSIEHVNRDLQRSSPTVRA